MKYIAIYKSDFSYIEKSNIDSIFSLPGEYYVFQKNEMTEQMGFSTEDPFIYLNKEQKPDRLIINDIEMTDIKILFGYNSSYSMTINLFDKTKKTNRVITRNGRNHTRAFHGELSFIVKTMTELPENRSWESFDAIQENIGLKKQIESLKTEVERLNQEINKLKAT